MFACHYDGCESDSDSLSDDVDEVEATRVKDAAEAFEDIMNTELDSFVNHLTPNKSKLLPIASENAQDEKSSIPTIDELYDEHEDEENSEWVSQNLPGGRNSNSDAVLNCPNCMSVLALDSHRNARVRTRYSSSYPINCTSGGPVTSNEEDPSKIPMKKSKAKSKASADNESLPTSLRRLTVKCEVCGTEVGMKDENTGVVTFTSVLASHV